jgi:hypothetical protein
MVIISYVKAPKDKSETWKYVFWAFLILGFGDFFHLASRIYIYFESIKAPDQVAFYDLESTISLIGMGLIFTSITVQLFYVLIYVYWRTDQIKYLSKLYPSAAAEEIESKMFKIDFLAISSSLARIVLVFYPYNNYGAQFTTPNYFRWFTNIPLYIIGIIIMVILFKRAKVEGHEDLPGFSAKERIMVKKSSWSFLISYICYSLTVFLTVVEPMFGMAMIPKTIAYLFALYYFYQGLLSKQEKKTVES